MKYKNPIKTDWMREQMAHEPTKQYAEDIHNFVKEFKPDYKNALEIGAAWGVSTLAILEAGEGELTSVDSNFKVKAHEEVRINNYWPRWKFHHSTSREFWRQNDNKYDLIYIDGSHLFQDVYDDLFQAWDCLENGGLLMVDDWTHKLNKDLDMNAKETIFGVSYALCCFIGEKQIEKQSTTMQIWSTIK